MKETHREKIFRAPFIVPSVTACVARAEWYQLSMDNPLPFFVGPPNIIQATVAIFRAVLPKRIVRRSNHVKRALLSV